MSLSLALFLLLLSTHLVAALCGCVLAVWWLRGLYYLTKK